MGLPLVLTVDYMQLSQMHWQRVAGLYLRAVGGVSQSGPRVCFFLGLAVLPGQ